MDTPRRLAVSGVIALAVASCATAAPNRYLPEVPTDLTPAEVPPVLLNEDEVRQEGLRAYPPGPLADGLGGRVEIWVRVDTAGGGSSGAVKTSSGHDDLDCAAMQVGDVMTFEPATNQGQPAETWVSEWVEFRPEAATGGPADPDRPPCEPWDTNPVVLNADDIVPLLTAAYPREVGEHDMEGMTIRSTLLGLNVGETGSVLEYRVMESSGYDALDDAAGIVAMQIRFEPARRLGRPTGVWVAQPISFEYIIAGIQEPREPWRPAPPPFQGP